MSAPLLGVSVNGRSASHCEELPSPWHTFECVLATILEGDSRPCDEVLHRARDEHLPSRCGGRNPGTDVHRYPCEVTSATFDLACVEPGSDINAEGSDLVADSARTAESPRWTIERSKKSISGGVDLVPVETI